MDAQQNFPQVLDCYNNSRPPFDVTARVRSLLLCVPAQQIAGLHHIELKNASSLNRDARRKKTWSRGKKVTARQALGLYHPAHTGHLAWIEIFVDNTLGGMPAWLPGLFKDVAIANVLYHEIGHHIHSTSNPEHREREDVADVWKRRLATAMIRRKYWYIYPLFRIAAGSARLRSSLVKMTLEARGK
jgi:hypothetical protein